MDGPTVFVVDDDEAVRDSLKLLLEAHGMSVETYASAERFVQDYRPRPRECLILDQHLQGLKTGLDFLLSPTRQSVRLPVILITGRGDNGLRARALAAGAAAYFDKPVAVEPLLAAIDEAVSR